MDYTIFIYIFFGILPSLVWLLYYLRKDMHPEPKRMILKIFLWGALITVPVFFVQTGFASLLDNMGIDPILKNVIYWFLIIAFSEEFFKYLVVRIKVINNPNLDEPVDLMIYMVVAALGFAALENVLYLLAPVGNLSFDQLIGRTIVVDIIRFVGATFLHTLCSALVGYFMAISICSAKKKWLYLFCGIFLATALHGIYDLSIITLDGYIKFIIPVVIILMLTFLVFSGFEKLKKMKGICKII